ncbi:MAG: hypothetical protein EXS08_03915 [Planctomycetes bacterium]|nr:hypothetical protein [Planctomycetota bacterium]
MRASELGTASGVVARRIGGICAQTLMPATVLAAGLLLIGSRGLAQDASKETMERAEWLRSSVVPIRSIDPGNEQFSDLMPLKSAIGDCRVVVLGEATHGDGATFLAKTRLIRFLHQELGFDVLVWESGMGECRRVGELLADDRTPLADAVEGIARPWSDPAQVRPLFEFLRATCTTKRPIAIAGVDCQLTSRHSQTLLSEAVRRLFAKLDPNPLTEEVLRWEQTLEVYHGGKRYAKSVAEANSTEEATDTAELGDALLGVVTLIEDQRRQLEQRTAPEEVELVRRMFLGADYQVRLMHATNTNGSIADAAGLSAERDRLMGENLVFLANQVYHGRKLIVWCATNHALLRAATIVDPSGRGPSPFKDTAMMGEIARRALGDSMYTIGFTAGHGSAGWIFAQDAMPIPLAEPAWLEALFAGIQKPYSFLDLRGLPAAHWLREPQVMRPLGYSPASSVWPDQMDAVIYIDEMFRASRDGLAPAGYALTLEGG